MEQHVTYRVEVSRRAIRITVPSGGSGYVVKSMWGLSSPTN